MAYEFLWQTYETERVKVLSAWSMFEDDNLDCRPHVNDTRGRSVREQMVHQCVSENLRQPPAVVPNAARLSGTSRSELRQRRFAEVGSYLLRTTDRTP